MGHGNRNQSAAKHRQHCTAPAAAAQATTQSKPCDSSIAPSVEDRIRGGFSDDKRKRKKEQFYEQYFIDSASSSKRSLVPHSRLFFHLYNTRLPNALPSGLRYYWCWQTTVKMNPKRPQRTMHSHRLTAALVRPIRYLSRTLFKKNAKSVSTT